MPRHTPPKTLNFARKSNDFPPPDLTAGNQLGNAGAQNDTVSETFAPTDEIYTELDGAVIQLANVAWRLSVWGIHAVGAERWIQLSATGSAQLDVVLHIAADARTTDVYASIETWLTQSEPANRIIHVSRARCA